MWWTVMHKHLKKNHNRVLSPLVPLRNTPHRGCSGLHRDYPNLRRGWHREAAFCWTNDSSHHFLFWIRSALEAQEELLTLSTDLDNLLTPPVYSTSPLALATPQESSALPSSSTPMDREPRTSQLPSSSTTFEFMLGKMSEGEVTHIKGLALIALAGEMNRFSIRGSLSIRQLP